MKCTFNLHSKHREIRAR